MEIIKLNLIPNGVNPTCHCSQYDNGRVIRIDLFDGLTPYVLQSGDTVTLNVRKPDNTIVTASLTATQGNTYVNLVTTEQMCACVGYNLCDLTITNGSVEIGTLNFIMQVERDVLADGIPSQSVIEDLDALVQEVVGDQYYTKTETDSLLNDKANLNDTVSGLIYGSENVKRGDIFPFRTDILDGGYYSINNGVLYTQTNTDYYGFILKVKPNTQYTCTFFRFLVLLESDKETAIGNIQSNNTIINTGNATYIAVSFNKNDYPVNSYHISEGTLANAGDYKIQLPWLFQSNNYPKLLSNGYFVEKENPSANSSIVVTDFSNNVKYNKTLVYEAHFSGSIGDIKLYHGAGTYGSYVKITSTNIVVNTSGNIIYNEAHNITIADYLYIFLDTDNEDNIKISVMSNGKRTEATASGWNGWQGQVFALTASALIYHRLTWTCKDINKSIWVFGDSYLSLTSQERWGYYIKQWGYANFMSVGYPGASSANIINSLKELLKITRPKYILWLLGMNDPDSASAINASWETNASLVKELCNQYDIIPIFSKIPNANGAGNFYNHSFKNAWIDNSNCRFIDVPFAVGADANGDWYNELLATDGIHPTWRGAEAIAYQFLSDVPELMET